MHSKFQALDDTTQSLNVESDTGSESGTVSSEYEMPHPLYINQHMQKPI